MKNYKVKATKNFKDKVENEERIAGKSEFDCTKERYEFLKSNRAVELVEIIEKKPEQIFENGDSKITVGNNEIKFEAYEIIEEPTKDELVEEIITKKKKTSKK